MKTPLSTGAADLLSDPTVQLMMAADRVHRAGLRDMLEGAAGPRRPTGSNDPAEDSYRRGVGMMVLSSQSRILLGQRSDVSAPAWQMPQGGIADGELPHEAAIRELHEEIGTSNVELLAESANWYRYDLPQELVNPLHGDRWRGQCQKWLLLRFTGDDADIDIATEHPEFSAWRWADPDDVLSSVAPFKLHVYQQVLVEFGWALPGENGTGRPPA